LEASGLALGHQMIPLNKKQVDAFCYYMEDALRAVMGNAFREARRHILDCKNIICLSIRNLIFY
jgi:hypothetical protein